MGNNSSTDSTLTQLQFVLSRRNDTTFRGAGLWDGWPLCKGPIAGELRAGGHRHTHRDVLTGALFHPNSWQRET